jgi:hypothetical protein
MTVVSTACLASCEPAIGHGRPCVVWSDAVRPLLVGDSTRPLTGRIVGSDCIAGEPDVLSWTTADTTVVTIARQGHISGRAPGPFVAVARADTTMLRIEGFVLALHWSVRATPESIVMVVGDMVHLEVRAVDVAGRALPPVPYWVTIPDVEQRAAASAPRDRTPTNVGVGSYQNVSGPVPIVGRRVGQGMLQGRIGQQRVAIPVRVTARESTDDGR